MERPDERESVVTAVGQHEESLPLLGRSHVRSTNGDARSPKPRFLECVEDALKSSSCGPAHVLPEDGFCFALDGDRELPEEESASVVFEPEAFSCDRVPLARAATNDEIHSAAPRPRIERLDGVPNRGSAQSRFFHPRHEAGRGVGFPLDVTNSASSSSGCALDSEVESATSAEEGENSDIRDGGTWSQVIARSRERGTPFDHDTPSSIRRDDHLS